jgi:hypothetical protein
MFFHLILLLSTNVKFWNLVKNDFFLNMLSFMFFRRKVWYQLPNTVFLFKRIRRTGREEQNPFHVATFHHVPEPKWGARWGATCALLNLSRSISPIYHNYPTNWLSHNHSSHTSFSIDPSLILFISPACVDQNLLLLCNNLDRRLRC